jgi:hypothetical protein
MLVWLLAFAFTQVVECPIYVAVLGRDGPKRSLPARLALAFTASAITHPVVWFVIPHLWRVTGQGTGYAGLVATSEAFAVLVEAELLRGFGLRRSLVWSLVANGASFGLGYLCWPAFGYLRSALVGGA